MYSSHKDIKVRRAFRDVAIKNKGKVAPFILWLWFRPSWESK